VFTDSERVIDFRDRITNKSPANLKLRFVLMSRRYRPAYLRYFKARLWNLARPSFWGTAIFLAVVGIGVYEYWKNPDFWQTEQKAENADNAEELPISDVDKAILADVDNLPVLLHDGRKNKESSLLPPLEGIVTAKTQKENKSTKQETNSNERTQPASSLLGKNSVPNVLTENPFLQQAENLLKGNNVPAGNNLNLLGVNTLPVDSLNPGVVNTASFPGVGLNNQNINNKNIPVSSALQTAIEKSIQSSSANPTTKELGNNSSINNNGWQSPGLTNNNLPITNGTTTGTNSYTQPYPIQQPNTVNVNPGYVQPGFNQQPNNSTNLLPNQEVRTNYSQPYPGTPQSNAGYIQPGFTNQQLIPNTVPPTNQVISQPNNYDNTRWQELMPRSPSNSR
jgi:hypothetical protein